LSLASVLSVTSALAQESPAPRAVLLSALPAPPPPGPRQEEPEEMPYRGFTPAGYHVESRLNKGLIIAGSSVLGASYVISVGFAAGGQLQDPEPLYIPIAGPFIQAAVVGGQPSEDLDRCSEWCGLDDTVRDITAALLVVDGIVQTAGALMLIAGLDSSKRVLVRDGIGGVPLTIAPMSLGRGGFGLGLAGKL
jgi:hypothetical protein